MSSNNAFERTVHHRSYGYALNADVRALTRECGGRNPGTVATDCAKSEYIRRSR